MKALEITQNITSGGKLEFKEGSMTREIPGNNRNSITINNILDMGCNFF